MFRKILLSFCMSLFSVSVFAAHEARNVINLKFCASQPTKHVYRLVLKSDKEADFQVIEDYFRGIAGKIPENGTFYP